MSGQEEERLRPVRTVDLPELAAIHHRCFPAEPWDRQQLALLLASPGSRGLLLAESGRAVAFLLWRRVLEEAEILTLAVSPERRRQGLATRLLDALVGELLAAGARRLFLEVAAGNQGAVALYRAQGFAPLGRRPRYYRDGADALVLGLSLPVVPASREDSDK